MAMITYDFDESTVILKKTLPKYSTRGNIKVPKSFPRFSANAIMIALWGSEAYLGGIYLLLTKLQHSFFDKCKAFKYSVVQGEYSEKGKAHLQMVIQADRKGKITTKNMYEIFQPENPTAMQCLKCRSIKDAIHYCQKPWNNCNCEHCVKSRLCKNNWASPVHCGIVPVGKGIRADWIQCNDQIAANPIMKTLIEDNPHLFMRYHAAMEKTMNYYAEKKAITDCKAGQIGIRKWEMDIHIQLYLWDPRDRKCIIWIWSKLIGTGKTEGVDQICYYYGNGNVMIGMKSYKHMVNCYRGETVIRFNYPLHSPPEKEDLELIETMCDGGMNQAAMYLSPKKNIQAHIIITANVGPPQEWLGERGRVRCVIDLTPPPTPPLPPITKEEINKKVKEFRRRLEFRNPFTRNQWDRKGHI